LTDQLQHLKRLSTIRSGKNIKFMTPAAYSGGWCPMRVACNICEDITGLSYLMVGMPECATHSRRMSSLPEGPHDELRRLYVLDANEVVFGCREGVVESLRLMDSQGARAILIIATCVTDLIGEDLEGIITELQPELQARLSYVTLGQFKNFGSPIGTWKTVAALGEMMQAQPLDNMRANAMFVEPWRNINDEVEFPLIVHALEEQGISIRRLAAGASLEDYLSAPDAALNLVLSSYTQPLAARMLAAFNTPYAALHRAFTVADIDKVYAQITDCFAIDFDKKWATNFAAWRSKALELEARAKRELAGLKYAFLSEVDMPVALALYLAGFGMQPLVIHIEDFHNEDLEYARQLKEQGIDPPVCRLMYIERDIEIIQHLVPDVCFGYLREPIEDFKCVEEMGDFFGMVGYERSVALLTRLFNVLETGSIGERMDIYGPAPL
jgi:nitrogenase molybdenum-iron protein alpha/beta subunit